MCISYFPVVISITVVTSRGADVTASFSEFSANLPPTSLLTETGVHGNSELPSRGTIECRQFCVWELFDSYLVFVIYVKAIYIQLAIYKSMNAARNSAAEVL
jgi:hypothetical protein